MNNTLSIVIPCYNDSRFITKNFEATLSQSVKPDQVIFIDNNSTDNSLQIANSFIDKFKQQNIDFKILTEKEQGQIAARAAGFKLAATDLIGTLDTDSIISKDWVKTAKQAFFNNNQLVAISGPFYFHNRSFLANIQFFFVFLIYKCFGSIHTLWGGNLVLKKAAYNQIKGLSGCQQMRQDLSLKYPSDDVYLTEKLKLIGKLKFIWKLKAKGWANYDSGRSTREAISFFRIRKYIRKKYKTSLLENRLKI